MKLSFHGGAREVTGACYLLETGSPSTPYQSLQDATGRARSGSKILIDCGLFQGSHESEKLNGEPFRFDPKGLDAIVVTHGHLDHVGRIPKLVREGFHGKIYSTPPTRDLARLILEDALHLAEREREALSTKEDLERTFSLWRNVPYHEEWAVGDIRLRFNESGHILGSALVELWAEGKHLLFSGDLGNAPSILLPPPEKQEDIEYLVIESTYGNRAHEAAGERNLLLERAVEDIAARGGTLIIPAFATERTQDLLHLLNELVLYRRIPEMPVFVDSPLAIRVTEVFEKYPEYYNDEIKQLFLKHPNLFKFKKLQLTVTTEESKKINDVPAPKVVIAGSGMMSGGRILHHARRYLSDSKSMLLITGYQAAGSLGRRLIEGEKRVKIFGEEIDVRAEIRKINGFSAHADNPQLFSFVESNRDALKRVFTVHGEEAQALHFAQEIKDRLGVEADAPKLGEGIEI